MAEYIEREALLEDLQAAVDNGGMGGMVAGALKRYVKRAPAVDVVPVEKLGQFGKLMLPYSGCQRGPVGRMGNKSLGEEALFFGTITDVDGGEWVPVVKEVLLELIEKAKAAEGAPRGHGRWEHDYNNRYTCTECLNREVMSTKHMKPFCPNCGAKMDGDEKC